MEWHSYNQETGDCCLNFVFDKDSSNQEKYIRQFFHSKESLYIINSKKKILIFILVHFQFYFKLGPIFTERKIGMKTFISCNET